MKMQEVAGTASSHSPNAPKAGRIVEQWQKIADGADFSDLRVDETIRRKLGVTPTIHARQWEFAVAYLALENAGKLKGQQKGISFGSGQEPLIFPVATEAGHLITTDLYTGSTAWEVARTEDCRAFVLAAAPPGFDASRLEVRSLDMRHIDYPDASFDFAYSISAFEHIGRDADFLEHLSGVRRILKPDGVYVLTTEVRFAPASYAVQHNYAFALSHLLDLFEKAGLNPEPRIDYRLTEIGENRPRDLRETKFRDASNPGMEQLLVREGGGVISAPMVFVLRPQPYQAPEIIGFDESHAWVNQQLAQRTTERFSDWCTLNPYGATHDSRSPYVDLWPNSQADKGPMVFATSYHYFGSSEMEARVTLTTSSEKPSKGSILVAIMSWSVDDTTDMVTLDSEHMQIESNGLGARQVRFRFTSESNRCYSVFGSWISGEIALSDVTVYARRAPLGEADRQREKNNIQSSPKFSLSSLLSVTGLSRPSKST